MEQSLFIEWINKYFKGVTIRIVESLNGKNTDTLTYMFKEMLRKEYSPSGKWQAINVLNTRVSADYVALDSSLPLKRRDSIGKVTGDIVKSGMELWLNETQLTELDTMIAQGVDDATIVAKLFQDTPRVISGVYELMERSFLEGFSTGVTVIDDSENVGLGVRMDFGYLDENKLKVIDLWSNPATAKPLDDLRGAKKKAKAKGIDLTEVYMDNYAFDNFVATDQVKNYFAWSLRFNVATNLMQVPTLEDINAAFARDNKYRITIHIVDRDIINERNGVRTVVTPWQEGIVIMTASTQVGILSWARLAEQNHPLPNVAYQTVDDYILVSMFRENRPSLKEFTTSQARVVPVISNVESIYQINTKDTDAEPISASDDINLDQPWQNVIADVKLSLNVDALNAALTAEQARTSPRASVVNAIEARIAELDTAG